MAAGLESVAAQLLLEVAELVLAAPPQQQPRELRRLHAPQLSAVVALFGEAAATAACGQPALHAALAAVARGLEAKCEAVRRLVALPRAAKEDEGEKKAEKKAKDIALKAEEKKKKEARLAQKKMDHDAKEASLRRVRYNAEPKPKKKYVHTGIGKKNKAIASANSN